MANDIYSDIALGFRDVNQDLMKGLGVRNPATPFADYFQQEEQRKQKEEEQKLLNASQATPVSFDQLFNTQKAPVNPVSDSVTAPMTKGLTDKSQKKFYDNLRTLLTKPKTNPQTGVEIKGLPQQEFGAFNLSEDTLRQAGILKDGETLKTGIQQRYGIQPTSNNDPASWATNVWIEPKAANPKWGVDVSNRQLENGEFVSPINPEFNINGFKITLVDMLSLGTLAYGGYQAIQNVAKPLFNRSMAVSGLERMAKEQGKKIAEDEINNVVNWMERNVKPSSFFKGALNEALLGGQAGGGQPTGLVPGNQPNVPANVAKAAQQVGNVAGQVAPVVANTLNQQLGLDAYGKAVQPIKTARAKSTMSKVLTPAQQEIVKKAGETADREIQAIGNDVEGLQDELLKMSAELSARSAPFHAGVTNAYPKLTTIELDAKALRYQQAVDKLTQPTPAAPQSTPEALVDPVQENVQTAPITSVESGAVPPQTQQPIQVPGLVTYDTSRLTGYERIYGLGDFNNGEITTFHVTDNPDNFINTLKTGKDITKTRAEGLVGDLGTSGLYVSDSPQIWTSRARNKWNFLNEINSKQKNDLIQKIKTDIEREYSEKYITNSEYETAISYLNNIKDGTYSNDVLVQLSGQPYNISFWEPKYLESLNVNPGIQPQTVEVKLQGKFADITYVKAIYEEDRTKIIDQLKKQGYDGVFVKNSMGTTAQGVIWNKGAIKSFGNYNYQGQHQPQQVVPPVTPPSPPQQPPSQPVQVQPSGNSGFLGDLQDTDELVTTMTKPDVYRKIANLPGVKNVMSYLNPAGVANTVPEKGVVARAALRDEGSNKAIGAYSYLEQLGTRDQIWGKLGDDFVITEGPLTGHLLDEVLTYRNKYASQLTPEQSEWAKRFHELEADKLDLLERNGIEINKLSFEDGGEYVGRRVAGKIDPNTGELIESAYIGAPGPGRPGAKLSTEKTRYFKDMADAVANGFKYLPPDEALFLNIKGAYNRIADKQMSDWILDRISYRTTGAPQELKDAAQAARTKLYQSKQMLAALNRALRGERGIPEQLVNSVEVNYPKEALELYNLIKDIRAGAETASRVKAFTAKVNTLIDKNTITWKKAVLARVQAREMAMKTHYNEAMVNTPAFAGKILTGDDAKETAQILNKAFNVQYGDIDRLITAVNKVNSIGRYFALAGDFSPFAIQLIMFPARFPIQYAKSAVEAFKALFSPTSQAEYLARNNDIIQKSRNLILSKGGQTEFTEAMRSGGILSGKSPVKGTPGEPIAKRVALAVPRAYSKAGSVVLQPFQRFFEAAIDTAGIELRKSFDYMATDPQKTAEIEQFINEIRGVTSSSRLGVSAHMRNLETAVTLAPRYNRAVFALVSDIARGGIRGDQARKALMALIAAGVAMAVAVTLARGEGWEGVKRHLDIRDTANFMTWDVAGQRIGPGSKIRSLLALLGKIIKEPERIIDHSYNFLRGNFSPSISTGYDIIMGQDYVGNPTRPGKALVGYGGTTGIGEGVLGLTKRVITDNLLPLWVQSAALEGSDIEGKAIRGAVEFLGGRSYEVSTKSLYSDKWRDDLADYLAIPSDNVAAANEGLKLTRTDYRKKYPEVEAKLFISGQVTSLSDTTAGSGTSYPAAYKAAELIKDNDIDPMEIKGITNRLDALAKNAEDIAKYPNTKKLEANGVDLLIKLLGIDTSTKQTSTKTTSTATTSTTSTQTVTWDTIAQNKAILPILNKVWYQNGTLTPAEEATLKTIYDKYPMGQSSFSAWYKQTLRQMFEKWANQVASK